MHDDIKRFELTGTITSDKFVSARESLVRELEASMRDGGFVPVLDLHPQFTREYNPETQDFNFTLSVYGTHVGEESWRIAGMMNGTPISRSTHQTK